MLVDKLNNDIIELMACISDISPICTKFKENPTSENGEKIVEILEKSEKKFLQIKDDIVIMINNMIEEDIKEEVEGIPSDNGFLIKKDKKE